MKIHVKIQDKTYEVTVGDLQARPVIASVDGEDFEVWPEEMSIPSESGAESSAMSVQPASQPQVDKPANGSSGNLEFVKAPLPGVIIEIKVAVRDQITYGQELCVLEAMKMKNVIRSNREGKIKTICVQVGDQVQHNTLLMEFED